MLCSSSNDDKLAAIARCRRSAFAILASVRGTIDVERLSAEAARAKADAASESERLAREVSALVSSEGAELDVDLSFVDAVSQQLLAIDADALQQLEDEGRFDALLWSARHNLFGAAPAAAATARSATAGPSAADARFGYWAAGGGAGLAAPPLLGE